MTTQPDRRVKERRTQLGGNYGNRKTMRVIQDQFTRTATKDRRQAVQPDWKASDGK